MRGMLISQVDVIRCPPLCRVVKRTVEDRVSSTAAKKENRFDETTWSKVLFNFKNYVSKRSRLSLISHNIIHWLTMPMKYDVAYRSIGLIMTRCRDDKGHETGEAFNRIHPNSLARMMREWRVEIIFLSLSRTADENNVGVGQEMVLPPVPVYVLQERLVFFHFIRSSDSGKHMRERERGKKSYMGSSSW